MKYSVKNDKVVPYWHPQFLFHFLAFVHHKKLFLKKQNRGTTSLWGGGVKGEVVPGPLFFTFFIFAPFPKPIGGEDVLIISQIQH